jgi:hypothetical protein
MHNPGGLAEYADSIYSYLSPVPYQQLQAVWRPTLSLLANFLSQLQQAEARNATPDVIAFYRSRLEQARTAYAQGADLTPPFPMLGTSVLRQPAKNAQEEVIAYTKPIMLLTNEFSVSAADSFAAVFQDNQRGPLFGTRTNGGGGNSGGGNVGSYSEGRASMEVNLAVRNQVVNVPGYPSTRYFDSVGVHPDIVADLMTRENLLNQGSSFSQAMVTAITNHALQAQP